MISADIRGKKYKIWDYTTFFDVYMCYINFEQQLLRRKTMWYVELNGKILPTPYQYFSDCLSECIRLQEEMCAVSTRPVKID
jgi:hypothetical protein